ncbi:MAG: hypothetical protein M9937_30530 [Chelatococcus sp.]|uniref:hypothetical protein n=1 Tax=Chelatococcus sp. TaxID=1953771 RepID=UPI00261D5EE8|nr:hypothetical protein [Chelatococcus sp.]MCO5080005.1 hypothetical protein [Chelatococcus sp.]
MIGIVVGVSPSYATDMTAGLIMKEMPAGERAAYVMGIVEGLAYARFRKDTLAAGEKRTAGMRCIYDWFYKDTTASFDRIETAFQQYPEHFPSTLLATMIKKKCDE